MYNKYTKNALKNQILSDKDSTGKERPWQEKKVKTTLLVDSYQRLGIINKAIRVDQCGNSLEFRRYKNGDLKLNQANFCQVRLCPMCIWRRGKKIFAQVSKVMNKALDLKDYRFIFLTLTCKNVEGENLGKSLDSIFYAFNKLTKLKQIKKSVKGWFRALEVTHNIDQQSTSYDTYHPHIHLILMVNKSYFTKPELYLSHDKWTSLWKECLDVDYDPIVNVKVFRTGNKDQVAKSVCESAKYAVKDNGFLMSDKEMTDKAVGILDSALSNRRLVAYGGELRKIHKELNLDDAETGDLVVTGAEEEIREDVDFIVERYHWNVGYKQYLKFEVNK